jgi:hypothetical protein
MQLTSLQSVSIVTSFLDSVFQVVIPFSKMKVKRSTYQYKDNASNEDDSTANFLMFCILNIP